jgi:hypothetical protein
VPVTIISVYPKEMKAERPFGPIRGTVIHTYVLPAAPQDGHSELEIELAWQHEYVSEHQGWRWSAIPEAVVAKDLHKQFSSGMIGQGEGLGPGIFIEDPDHPLNEQVAAARQRQTDYFNYLYKQGESAFRAGMADSISDEMRNAATWLGKSPEWLTTAEQVLKKECPVCASEIPRKAFVCPVCRHKIAELPAKLRAMNPGREE